jgi:hypothetical protein
MMKFLRSPGFNLFVSGFCTSAALDSAAEGWTWFAVALSILAVSNLWVGSAGLSTRGGTPA